MRIGAKFYKLFPFLENQDDPVEVPNLDRDKKPSTRTERRHFFRRSGLWIVESSGCGWVVYSTRNKDLERRARDRHGRFKMTKTPQVVTLSRGAHYRLKEWHCWLAIIGGLENAGPSELASRVGRHRRTIQRALCRPDVQSLIGTIRSYSSEMMFGGSIELRVVADCRQPEQHKAHDHELHNPLVGEREKQG